MRKKLFCLLLSLPAFTLCEKTCAQKLDQLLEQAQTSKDSAQYYFQLASTQATSNQQKAHLALARNTYFFNNGFIDSNVLYGKEAIRLGSKLDSFRIVITAYKNIARGYSNEGLYDLSSKYALEGLRLAEKNQSLEWISWFNKMQSLNQHDFESYEKGVEYGKIAYTKAVQSGTKDLTLITYALNAIAINFDDWNKPDSALFYHRKIFDYIKGADTVDYYFTFNNIGNTLLKQKQYGESEAYLNRALNNINLAVRKTDSSEFYYDYATTLTNLATVAYKQQQFKKAGILFEKAKYFSEKTGNAEKLRDYYQQRYLFNKERKNIDEMAKYQELYITLRDSVFNSKRAKTFADLEEKYQTEKKEAEIKVLNIENKRQRNIIIFTISSLMLLAIVAYLLHNRFRLKQKSLLQKEIIRQQNEAAKAIINAEENERQRMSQTLHDGLGQYLSATKMNLQALTNEYNTHEKNVEIYHTAISLLDQSIAEMRSVSHQMVTNNVMRSGLGNALKDLIEKIDRNRLKVALNIDGLLQNVDPDIQLVVYRIIQESINNVIKHANASQLDIVLNIEHEHLTASIKDNGTGFDTGNINLRKGIGLDNIETRVKFLKGTYQIVSSPGNGTAVTVEIPL